MFEKVLVPVDFSEHSKAAFGHGVLFAKAFGGRLELVHVVEHLVHTHVPFLTKELALADQLQREAIALAEARLQKLVPSLPVPEGLGVDTRILPGTLPHTLLEHAAESRAGLIVVSTHGRTGLARWLMGSVSERLLRGAPCPVLVARGGSANGVPSPRRLLVAVDLSEHSRRALHVAGQVAQRFGAALEVVYVWAAPFYADEELEIHARLFDRIRESARAELESFVAQCALPAGVNVQTTILSGTPTAKIVERVRSTSPDLLVIGTHGHGGFKRMVLGSVAESTVRYASCATLVVG